MDVVLREVLEETGLEAVADHVAALYDKRDIDFLHIVFACHLTDASAAPTIDPSAVSARVFWPVEVLRCPT